MVKPKATATSRTVVQIKLSKLVDGRWNVISTQRAKLIPSGGTRHHVLPQLTVPAKGAYSVRAFHYRAGKLVKKSEAASFDVAQRITIDSMVNGWMAP